MFGNSKTVKIERDLHEKLAKIAKVGSYSSTKEFIIHVLEPEAVKFDEPRDDAAIEDRLRDLGYID